MDRLNYESEHVQCCVVGGGPAGMMLGLLLARAGIDVMVIEKHEDFFRDFRGDTIHPSTLELMHELGLLDKFLMLPHEEAREICAQVGDEVIPIADFSHLPTRCKFIAFMPQWDFLNFIAAQSSALPTFRLRLRTEATDLIVENGCVRGVRARVPGGALDIRADLTIGADGRRSTIREKAGLDVINVGAPMDVLWMKFSRFPNDPGQTFFRVDPGRILLVIDRGDYWQCGFVIPKNSFEELVHDGLPAFRAKIAQTIPFLSDRVSELASWDDVKLLTVAVDRLMNWYRPGLLCIGDAAHAMSPIGGVGINLAIQDAVAAANILTEPLRGGIPTVDHLHAVQRRRHLPARFTQAVQVFIQNRVISNILVGARSGAIPLPLRMLRNFPFLRRLPGRIVGLGFRPEHVRTRAATSVSMSRKMPG